jgi:hypothetical protein
VTPDRNRGPLVETVPTRSETEVAAITFWAHRSNRSDRGASTDRRPPCLLAFGLGTPGASPVNAGDDDSYRETYDAPDDSGDEADRRERQRDAPERGISAADSRKSEHAPEGRGRREDADRNQADHYTRRGTAPAKRADGSDRSRGVEENEREPDIVEKPPPGMSRVETARNGRHDQRTCTQPREAENHLEPGCSGAPHRSRRSAGISISPYAVYSPTPSRLSPSTRFREFDRGGRPPTGRRLRGLRATRIRCGSRRGRYPRARRPTRRSRRPR